VVSVTLAKIAHSVLSLCARIALTNTSVIFVQLGVVEYVRRKMKRNWNFQDHLGGNVVSA
jgi:hypothetical protein